jgi:RNA polymerase sigma factor (sigma-70 family)
VLEVWEMTTRGQADHHPSTVDSERAAFALVVARARGGDPAAWQEIVKRYDHSLRGIARAHGLDSHTCRDVVQQTWLAAVSRLEALRTAEALGGWLFTIARRESRRMVARRNREALRLCDFPTDEPELEPRCDLPTPESEVLRTEQRALLRTAWRQLTQRDQNLLTLLMAESRPQYAAISRATGLPVGSIGPTRARCLARLRGELEALGVHERWTAA